MIIRRKVVQNAGAMWLLAIASPAVLWAQNPPDTQTTPPQAHSSTSTPKADRKTLPKFGLAIAIGTSGPGIEAATAVARRTNIRGGFNYFNYSVSGTASDNIAYKGTARLESGEILLDQYLAGPLHISGGAMVYNGFQGSGSLYVPAGETFTLNRVTYFSAASDPVTGTGLVSVRKVAPEVLFGIGNWLPRGARHFGVNFELGVAFEGSARATLNLSGSTCISGASACLPIASDPSVQTNIAAEQNKLNTSLKPYWFYPILRITFGSRL